MEDNLTIIELTLFAIIDDDNRIMAMESWMYDDEAIQWQLDLTAKGIHGRLVVLDLYRWQEAHIGDKVIADHVDVAELE